MGPFRHSLPIAATVTKDGTVVAAALAVKDRAIDVLRFDKGETKNKPEFAKALAALADAYVDDAFGSSHRAHASVSGMVEDFPPEYAAEPRMAHLGGEDGLDLARRIIQDASAQLAPGGGLLCEIGEDRAFLEQDYPDHAFLWLDSAESEGEVFWLAQGNGSRGT
jgi:hypothetical protein